MVLACDKWDRVADNIGAIAAHIGALRGIERWGVGSLDQAFSGYAALPAPGEHAKRPWWAVLGFEHAVSIAVAESMFKRLAMEHHPDLGGNAVMFCEISEAIAEARRELKGGARPAPP